MRKQMFLGKPMRLQAILSLLLTEMLLFSSTPGICAALSENPNNQQKTIGIMGTHLQLLYDRQYMVSLGYANAVDMSADGESDVPVDPKFPEPPTEPELPTDPATPPDEPEVPPDEPEVLAEPPGTPSKPPTRPPEVPSEPPAEPSEPPVKPPGTPAKPAEPPIETSPIGDNGVPTGNIPKTGEDDDPMLYIASMGITFLATGMVLMAGTRKKDKTKRNKGKAQ